MCLIMDRRRGLVLIVFRRLRRRIGVGGLVVVAVSISRDGIERQTGVCADVRGRVFVDSPID